MKGYIINLARAPERRVHILKQAQKRGLDFELLSAVDGASLSDDDIAANCDADALARHPDWLTRGVIGAALSHRMACARVVADGLPCAFIMEDDVELPEGFAELLDDVGDKIGDGEIVLLHYMSLSKLGLSRENSVPLAGGHELLYPMTLEKITSAACYVVSHHAAKALHDGALPIRFAPDSWIDFRRENIIGKIRFVYPRPVDTIGAKSTINVLDQSFLRSALTQVAEGTPLISEMVRWGRRKLIGSRSKFHLVTERSPLDEQL